MKTWREFNQNLVEKKSSEKPKRWWDDDGNDVGYEKGEVDGKFSKKSAKKKS